MYENYILFIVLDTWNILTFYSNINLLIYHYIYRKKYLCENDKSDQKVQCISKWRKNRFLLHPNTRSNMAILSKALYCNFRLLYYILVSYYLRVLKMCLIFIIIRKYGVSNPIILLVLTKIQRHVCHLIPLINSWYRAMDH